jgi:tetratricopeptide (TPR) repeat protein
MHSAVRMNLLVQRLGLAVAACDGVETPELTELFAAFAAQVERLVAAGQHYPVAKGCEDIADAYISLGRYEQARAALQIGVKSADAAKAGPDRGVLELRLGRLERLAGQYRAASAHIGLALELLAEGALLKELAEAHLENSLLNEERQHWRAALDSYRESAQIRERLLIAQSDARAHALTVRLELGRDRGGD